jgi:hypothetical protein
MSDSHSVTPGISTAIPRDTAAHLVKFLQLASPDEIEALLSAAHSLLQAGVAQRSLEHTRHILARDAS